jgi:cytochrome c heme-lyase
MQIIPPHLILFCITLPLKEMEPTPGQGPAAKCPVQHEEAQNQVGPPQSCPVDHPAAGIAPYASFPFSFPFFSKSTRFGGPSATQERRSSPSVPGYNPSTNEYVYGNERAADQRVRLANARETSSIPMAKKSTDEEPVSAHQPTGAMHWVYPSEQQYYNALKKKGWQVKEGEVPMVLAIHNAVNEQGWKEVRRWEALLPGRPEPRLKRFMGKPATMSPKAWWKTYIGGALPPFDRHDWVVDRGGSEVRYVIDFYAGTPTPEKPVAFHLDVRPALDCPQAFLDRFLMWTKDDVGIDLTKVLGLGRGQGGEAAITDDKSQ